MSGVHAVIFTELMRKFRFNASRSLGAYKIASEIRRAGYTCQVIDFFTKFSDDEMDKILAKFIGDDTLIVGFSSTFFERVDVSINEPLSRRTTQGYPFSEERVTAFLSKIKAINPKIKIVFGGGKSQFLQAQCDIFIHGFGDVAVVDYMKYLEGTNPFFQFTKVNDNQISCDGTPLNSKLDFSTNMIEWHPSDFLQHGETLPMETSRGCIFRCKFCSYPLGGKRNDEHIKKESVLRDEFLRNYYEYGTTRYMYSDDTYNDSISKIERLHRVVTSLPFELEFSAYLRIDLLYAHQETIPLLRESGLRGTFFGIESLNHESAKAIGKGIHPEKVKEILYKLREDYWKDEVSMRAGFIVGLPHDTHDTVREWSSWLLQKDCPLHGFDMLPLYLSDSPSKIWKSEFELNASKYGYTTGKYGHWENKNFTFASAELLANEISRAGVKTQSGMMGGLSIVLLGNIGLEPRANIVNGIQIGHLRLAQYKFIRSYQERLLDSIT